MEPTKPETPKQTVKSSAYDKRPVWQWIIIYLVVAVIVYGLIYLLFIHKGSASGSSTYGY